MELPRHRNIIWDVKEQPEMDEFTKAAREGLVYFNKGYFMEMDAHLVVAAERKLTKDEIRACWADDDGFK